MGKGIKTGADMGILGMLSLGEFVKQVVHYITFSIGVQLVMGIKQAFEVMITSFKDFEQQAIRTAAVTGRLDAGFDEVVEGIKDVASELARTSVFMGTDVTKAMYDFASAGFDVAGVVEDVKSGVETLRPVLNYAVGQQVELTEATDLVSTTLKQFGMDLSETERLVDTFTAAISNSFLTNEKLSDMLTHVGAVAHTFGLSLEETTAAGMAVADAGFRASTGGRALRMILLKLVDPSEKAKKALASIGLTMRDLDPATHSFAEILYTLRNAGFDASIAAQVFRARTAGVATAMVETAGRVSDYNRLLQASAGITDEVAKKNRESFAGSLAMVMAKLDDIGRAIGERLAPIIRGLGGYLTGTLIPSLRGVIATFDMIGSAIGTLIGFLSPLKPILGALTTALTVFAGVWITAKTASLAFAAAKWMVAKATAAATLATQAFTFASTQEGAVTWSNTSGLWTYIAAKFAHMKATFAATVATHGFTAALLACPLTWIAVAIGAVVGALAVFNSQTEQSKAETQEFNQKIKNISSNFEDYQESLDDTVGALREYEIAQDKVNDLVAAGEMASSSYTDALAEAEDKMEAYENAEREFLANSSKVIDSIADRNKTLANFVNQAKKSNTAEMNIIRIDKDLANTMDLISKKQDKLSKVREESGINSEEYIKAESEVVKLKGQAIDLEEELTGETGNLTDEQKKQINTVEELTNLQYAENSALDDYSNKIRETEDMLTRLTSKNKEYADITIELLDIQRDYTEAMDEMSDLQSKQNVLRAAQTNIEENVLDAISDLVDAELDLYDIEEKIYKLRNGQIDETRKLFDALANQGALTSDIIDAYKGMEQAQGQSLRTHIQYTKALENLGSDQKKSVMEWTHTYINSLDMGLSSTQAFLRTNDAMGYALQNLEGVTSPMANAVLEYAEAEHEARYTGSQLESQLSGHVGIMVDVGEATNETANAYYDMVTTDKELAKQNVELEETNMDVKSSTEELATSISRLGWYYVEVTGEASSFSDALDEMIIDLGLANTVGTTQGAMLDSLNTFYGVTRGSVNDFSNSEIVAFLAGNKLNKTLGDTGTKITNVKDSAEPAITKIDTLTTSANNLKNKLKLNNVNMSNLKGYFDGLESTDYTWMDMLDDIPYKKWKNFETTLGNVYNKIRDDFRGLKGDISDLTDDLEDIEERTDRIDMPEPTTKDEGYWDKTMEERRKDRDEAIRDNLGEGLGADIVRGIDVVGQGLVEGIGQPVADTLGGLKFWEKGGIAGLAKSSIPALQSGIAKTSGPQLSVIGENGAEAVVPLEGINKKYGRAILGDIIPEHFPEFGIQGMQTGGVVGTPTPINNTTTNSSSYIIEGDINVYGVQDVEEFMDELIRELEDRRRMVRD